jgi:hypothetical protein
MNLVHGSLQLTTSCSVYTWSGAPMMFGSAE